MSSNYYDYSVYGSDYSTYGNEFLGGILAIFGLILVFLIVILIFSTICWWFIFKKAGKPGWAAIVPVYNNIVMLEIAGMPWWNIFILFGLGFLSGVLSSFDDVFLSLISSCLSIATCVYSILINIRIANNFGKDSGFKVLIALVPIVGLPMLAFGKSTYMKSNINTNNPVYNSISHNFCSNCGNNINYNSKFCANCGRSIK